MLSTVSTTVPPARMRLDEPKKPTERTASPDPDDAIETVVRTRFSGGARTRGSDAVVREEPLEIQLGAASLAVVMRTPGDDEDLALGFLVTERVVRSRAEVLSVRHSSVAATPRSEGNVVRVSLAPGVAVDLERLRRNLYASASCGICGKATLDAVLADLPPLEDGLRLPAAFFAGLADRVLERQAVFAETGGIHAAALVSADGRILAVREDVGRHNAVDKVVGWAAADDRLPLAGHVLFVSGRVSYEIAQKALAARIPVVAAVSAPSSLAVELAERAGMTLVTFLRGDRFNVHGREDRITG